jgi:hypothetical protein
VTPASEKLLSLYRRAIRLYPSTFQEDYAEELAEVFAMRLQGNRADIKTVLRELRDLPLALVAAYLRERRRQKMKHSRDHWFTNNAGSWRELLLACLPFLLTGFVPGLLSEIPAVQGLPPLAGMLVLGTLFLILAALGITGLLVRLPRWSLTYAGVSLTLLTLSLIAYSNQFGLISISAAWSVLHLNVVLMGVFLVVLTLSTWILLWASGHIRLMQPFAANLKHDHTLISFMFYGGALVLTLSHYEDIPNGGVYLMLSALALAAGAWGYLRAAAPATRIWALIGGTTLASALTLTANLRLLGVPNPAPISFAGLQIQAAVGFVGLTWIVSMIMVLAPLALRSTAASLPEAQTT